MQDSASELCAVPLKGREYDAPACCSERTLPDTSSPGNMSPLELLFGRKPRATLDASVLHVDDAKLRGGLAAFIEQRKQA